VGHQHDRRRRFAQEQLERLARRNVEVVGGLIQQQQLAGVTPSRASSRRERSPPDSLSMGLKTSSPRNRKRAKYERAGPISTPDTASSASSTVAPGMDAWRTCAR
jgi:hypothetical protein